MVNFDYNTLGFRLKIQVAATEAQLVSDVEETNIKKKKEEENSSSSLALATKKSFCYLY